MRAFIISSKVEHIFDLTKRLISAHKSSIGLRSGDWAWAFSYLKIWFVFKFKSEIHKSLYCLIIFYYKLPINIFQSACLSILLYGCESWIIDKKLEQSLNSYSTSCFRIMLNIKRLDKISNEEIYTKIGITPLVHQIQRRQLKYVGHCLRKDKNELINKYVLYKPEDRLGKRGKGRARLMYPEYIGELINDESPPSIDDIREAAKDRKEWRKKVVDVCKPKLFAVDWWWWMIG